MNKHAAPHRPRGPRQDGVVLIVALVMLVIIGLGSVAVMRNVMSNDLVAENNRRHAQAMQAAQAALRYCEELLLSNAMSPAAPAAAPSAEAWRSFSTWDVQKEGKLESGGPVQVDAGYLQSQSEQNKRYEANRAPRPQCMAQERDLGGNSVIVVTARGFSDNFVAGAKGQTEAGAVVWLQSILQLAAAS